MPQTPGSKLKSSLEKRAFTQHASKDSCKYIFKHNVKHSAFYNKTDNKISLHEQKQKTHEVYR